MPGMTKVTLAALMLAAMASAAQAQTRPAVTSLGPNYPKTEMFVGTGRSPIGNSYCAGFDEPTAKFLQEVARETVQDY